MPAIVLNAFPRALLLAVFEGIADVPVIWDGDPIPRVAKALVTLAVISNTTLGVDEERQGYDAAKDVTTFEQDGLRQYVIQVKAESYTDAPAFDILEKVRTRICRASVRQQLNAMQLAFMKAGTMIDLDAQFNNRAIWLSTMDLTFSYVVTEAPDDQPDAGGTIEEVDNPEAIIPGPIGGG